MKDRSPKNSVMKRTHQNGFIYWAAGMPLAALVACQNKAETPAAIEAEPTEGIR